ncbi:MAG TPA: endonuclease [Gemmataceae bacterium]|nr:endonuclease [Gemmataceae bacterium]
MPATPLPTKVLDATAKRMRQLFGAPARPEALNLPEGTTPQRRHEALRQQIEKLTPAERLRSNPLEAVQRRLERLGLPVEAARRVARERSAVGLEGFRAPIRPGLERIIGRNELLAVRYLDGGLAASRAVARVVVRSAGGADLGFGTGSMVSSRLFMTNNHVLDTKQAAGASVIEFNYQLGLDDQLLRKVTFALDPDTFFRTSPQDELDMTIVAVRPTATDGSALDGFGFSPLRAVDGEVLNGEGVTVIQHPGGEPKQIALRENRVLKLPNTADRFLYYETDTTPGSSGSPVFNDQWEVVALHHSGYPDQDAQGNYLTPDGQIWTPGMGEHRIHWIANEGIRVAAILQFLSAASGLTDEQKRLRDGATNPARPADPPERNTPKPAAGGAPIQAGVAPGTAVWTIPLTVAVNFGVPSLADAPSAAAASGGPTPAAAPVGRSAPAGATAPAVTDADLSEAKAELERARTRTYYDREADERDRRDYYDGLRTDLTRSKLYEALNDLLTRTHQNTPAYKPMKHVYPWVDLQPNWKLRSVYSSQEFEPIELIERDFEVERLRQERLARFRRTEAARDPVLEAVELDRLEAALPFNCEHVVPQSWFDKEEPMRGDLHHLFACESGCNSFRSNIPYFDFADFREAIRSDCGKRDENRFEPHAGKGVVARATLYFLLRYPGRIDDDDQEYTGDRIETLVRWHKESPPNEYERHRNQAIFAIQGNRNPLIDLPDVADVIDFTRGLG